MSEPAEGLRQRHDRARAAPRTSIRHRMMRVVMTTNVLALVLSATVLLLYELRTHRSTWLQDLQTQADLMAQSSAPALAFDDARMAQENLALLRLRPQIESAAIYNESGRLFAAYATDHAPIAAAQLGEPPPDDFVGDRLELRRPVVQNGEVVGTMVLQARYDVLQRLWSYLAILGSVSLASLVFASLVARRLQSTITDPIVAVSDVAREVVQDRNFALRARKTTDDEVGALVDAFNDMLSELGGQAAALQAADRRKDEFLATLAHELRNPLAPVATALTILSRPDSDTAMRARLVPMMQRQMQQFVRLIDDLMEVSRISTGRLELRAEPVDLVEVVRSAVESVGPALQEQAHTLVVDWPPPIGVSGDRTRLAQVFVNLLGNACKYTDAGGRITISFALEAGAARVWVADTGIGIAPEMHADVFEMFVQIDRSLARGRTGLGVGLSLARQLVELHQGSLTLHSAGLGQGSTFCVCLPRLAAPPEATRRSEAGRQPEAERPPAAAEAGIGPDRPGARSLRILLADDNRDFADSLAEVLGSAGHRVQVSYDGREALRCAMQALPEVGLFDVGMPGLDGYELATAVRHLPGGAACRLVAVTGWGQQNDRSRGRAAGFDHHLVKPVDPDTLLDLLAKMG